MMAWEYLGIVLMLPVAGLVIGGVMMLVVARDAAREDRRHGGTPAE